MRRLFRIYLEKPELAGIALLVLLTLVFETRSDGVFLSAENLRGILGLLPEVGLVSIGVTVLMICGEFDLSVGSMFALMPVSVALMTDAGVPFHAGNAARADDCRGGRLRSTASSLWRSIFRVSSPRWGCFSLCAP